MNREVWTGHTTPMANRGARAGGSTGTRCSKKKINEEEDFPVGRRLRRAVRRPPDPDRLRDGRLRRGDLRGVEKEEFGDFVEFHQELGRAMRENGYWFYEGAEQFVDGSA